MVVSLGRFRSGLSWNNSNKLDILYMIQHTVIDIYRVGKDVKKVFSELV